MCETVYFRVESSDNLEVYVSGFVEIDEEYGDDDWFYYDHNGMPNSQIFYVHDGVDGFKGATFEQECEIEDFKNVYLENIGEISQLIRDCSSEENRTYEKY